MNVFLKIARYLMGGLVEEVLSIVHKGSFRLYAGTVFNRVQSRLQE
jgi:hypothetical protein